MREVITIFAVVFFLAGMVSCSLFDSDGDDGPQGPPPEIPGRLVFSTPDEQGNQQIFSSYTNGSDLRQLTRFEQASGTSPAWSPDGEKIIFASTALGISGSTHLFIMDADGDNLRVLEHRDEEGRILPTFGGNPRWSPDGSKIAYDSCLNCNRGGGNFEIFVYDFETQRIAQITDHPGSDSNPEWHPFENSIAFTSDRADPLDNAFDIYTLNLLDQRIERVTETERNTGRQLWYHSGEQLMYWSDNRLFKLDLIADSTQQIPVNLPPEIGFRPLSLSSDDQFALLISFDLTDSRAERALMILDLATGDIVEEFRGSALTDADLFDK